MQVGQFFSFQPGRVGQYLSPRVLVVRSPFRATPDVCYLGFDHFKQAQTFAQSLARRGIKFQIRRSQVILQQYEIRLHGCSDLARTLAYWDRRDVGLTAAQNGQAAYRSAASTGAIAA
ncbi:MAG TPA: hypothetical protein V6D34_18750 [Candidatus Sericytochromatia bacterium]